MKRILLIAVLLLMFGTTKADDTQMIAFPCDGNFTFTMANGDYIQYVHSEKQFFINDEPCKDDRQVVTFLKKFFEEYHKFDCPEIIDIKEKK